jgi:DNA modification methylase
MGMDFADRFLEGDCEELLKSFPDNSIDLIFTSPLCAS